MRPANRRMEPTRLGCDASTFSAARGSFANVMPARLCGPRIVVSQSAGLQRKLDRRIAE